MAVIGSSSSGNSSKGIQLVFGSSTSYKPPYKCKVLVHAIGAGGGGGAAAFFNVTNSSGACAGGGAGAYCTSVFTLDPTVTYTITVAAVTPAVYRNTQGQPAPVGNISGAINGNSGGTTTFAGTGVLTLSAAGGSGGAAAFVTSGTATAAGGAGAVAGNSGNVGNVAGGAGGSASITSTYGGSQGVSGGGGAVGIFGVGHVGGSAIAGTVSALVRLQGGGAGVGGPGSAGIVNGYAGGGAGIGGVPAISSTSTSALTTFNVDSQSDANRHDGIFSALSNQGGTQALKGSGGSHNAGSTGYVGGWFGGGGGSLRGTASGNMTPPTASGVGGGGGGSTVYNNYGTGHVYAQGGGQGMIIIDVLEILI
tara:strand:- start:293 stop:1387 length:1095 start_codon:yes stop_codon:yes gene_type:complete